MPLQPIVIKVANPSPYERSDYVEIDDLGALGTPPELDEKTLRLTRLRPGIQQEVPFQIDCPFGPKALRTLTFFAANIPREIQSTDDTTLSSFSSK